MTISAPTRSVLASNEVREAALLAARNERDRFKRDVNLIAYAASRGYVFNKAKTSINFPALRHPTTGHKVLIGKGKDGHWLYYSVNRDDSGSIIDFVQSLEGGKDAFPITKVLQELREWTNTPRELPAFARAPIQHVPKDRGAVAATVEHAHAVDSHRYLEARGITGATLRHPRFRGTWRESGARRDERDLPAGTVLFLHHDEQGLSGFETKHRRFTGFARAGTKALWWSGATPTDNRLVIAESAIDALSYHEVNPHPRTRYVSFAGAMNAQQPELISRAISWMPAGSTVVAATDRDKEGHAFAAQIAELSAKHPHVTYERHAPSLGRKDWNDHLQVLRAPERSRGAKDPGIER